MLFFDGGLGLIFVAVWIFCIIDVITTPERSCRNLPKLVWLAIVVLLMDVGSIAWLVAGRAWNGAAGAGLPSRGNRGAAEPLASPGRTRALANPDDDEQFLAGLRERAEEQRRRAREAEAGEEPAG